MSPYDNYRTEGTTKRARRIKLRSLEFTKDKNINMS